MALFQSSLFSYELCASVNVNVILPLPDSGDIFFKTNTAYPSDGKKFQTLWLLHGATADYSDWCRFSGIERYAQECMLAVVMPSVGNSMYSNIPNIGNYYDYYTKELPHILRSVFPLSEKREDNFIAGLSMGGFGAFAAAMREPEKYAAAISLSGGLTMSEADMAVPDNAGISRMTGQIRAGALGNNREFFDPHKQDLFTMIEDLISKKAKLPLFYEACGTEDFVYPSNIRFRDYAQKKGLPLTYEEGPGVHNWDFWDPYIRRAMHWLPTAGKLVG